MAPISWSAEKVIKTFPNVTNNMFRKPRQLLKEKGILAAPNEKKGKQLAVTTTTLVNDEYMNSALSILRYLLISPKFCSLRPKWCILVGSSGSHSVSVCTYHQSTNLLVNAAKIEQSVCDITEMIICGRVSRMYDVSMSKLPRCRSVAKFLETKLIRHDEEEINITFKLWPSTDRAEFITRIETVNDFIEYLIGHLDKLTKSDPWYLKPDVFVKFSGMSTSEIKALLDEDPTWD
ncbi:unnamed protein product [Lepeophtheirus salmonis]|uniref:(salmon louse) hypothetical protein n=1 Tax=Lepeophtheirus salmonis TaxID=72036 RepID=A0A7R8GZ88_LEPSM|nr:unnamed protein product [Lepeophtheirus salmonis]CAF2761386.1 unnamed protein product [Lepeophtheirus salmonis]